MVVPGELGAVSGFYFVDVLGRTWMCSLDLNWDACLGGIWATTRVNRQRMVLKV